MKTALYLGRFQPKHSGHQHVIDEALKVVDRVIVCIGSSYQARTTRNPFTYEERKAMFPEGTICVPLLDFYDEGRWIQQVKGVAERFDAKYLVGHAKDSSSYYLDLFPELERIEVDAYKVDGKVLSATQIREQMYSVPSGLEHLREMNRLERMEQDKFDSYPYPESLNCVCADALIFSSSKRVLLVRRQDNGRLALPGGHVNRDETLKQAAERELREETGIDLRLIGPGELFDNPRRASGYIRKLTVVFVKHVTAEYKLEAGDDAESAEWHALKTLDSTEFHDDHFLIIDHFSRR